MSEYLLTLCCDEFAAPGLERVEAGRGCCDQGACNFVYELDVLLEVKGCVIVAQVLENEVLQDWYCIRGVQFIFLHEPLGFGTFCEARIHIGPGSSVDGPES